MQGPFEDTLPVDLDQRLRSELRPGERIVWVGRPLAKLARRGSILLVVFGVPFTGFALFWMFMAGWIASQTSGDGGSGPFGLFWICGLPFLAVGLGMLTSPFWAARAAGRTAYAVTSERAVVLKVGVWGTMSVVSFAPDRLTRIERRERPDGSGDLIFEEFVERRGSGSMTVRRGFIALADVRDVEEIVRRTLTDRKRPQGQQG
jgi:hypothetical protein